MGCDGLDLGNPNFRFLIRGSEELETRQMSTSSSGSWHQTALSILAGAGAGYLLGMLSARLLWGRDRGRGDREGRPGLGERVCACMQPMQETNAHVQVVDRT